MKPPQSPFEILLAEDNSGDAMLVREVLDRHEIPCNLRVVTDGAEAISLIEQIDHEPQPRLDLLLMDMHLPKYEGPAILERLRESRHLSNTPVIVLSGLTATQLHARTDKFRACASLHEACGFPGIHETGRARAQPPDAQ